MIDADKLLQKIRNTYEEDSLTLSKGCLTVFAIDDLCGNIKVQAIQQDVSLAVIRQGNTTTYVYRRVIKGQTLWAVNKLKGED